MRSPQFGRTVVFAPGHDEASLRHLLPEMTFDVTPAEQLAEIANWLLTRSLESSGVDHNALIDAGPPQQIDAYELAPAGRSVKTCALHLPAGGGRVYLFWERPG